MADQKYRVDPADIRPNIGNSVMAEDLRKGIAALEQGFMNAPSGIDPDAYEKAVLSSVGAYLGQRGINAPAEAMKDRNAMSNFMYGQMDRLTRLPDAEKAMNVTIDEAYDKDGLVTGDAIYTLDSVSRAED